MDFGPLTDKIRQAAAKIGGPQLAPASATTTPTVTVNSSTVAGPTTAPSWSGYGSFGGYNGFDYYRQANELDEIAPYVFQGGKPDLLPAGIDAVLNVNGSSDRFPSWQPIQGYIHLPIGDVPNEAPSVEWLGLAVSTVERFRAQGWTVLIHCAMGISRSGMVSVAYVMKKDRLTVDAALAKVRKGRPCTHPNSGFLRSLAAWQRHLGITGPAPVETAPAQPQGSLPLGAWAGGGREGVVNSWSSIDPDLWADQLGTTAEYHIAAPASGKDEDRVPCTECGHKWIHAKICPTVNPNRPVARPASEDIGAITDPDTGEKLGTITGELPPLGVAATAPTVEDEDEEEGGYQKPDGIGTPTVCGQCGRDDALVIAQFEDGFWCAECLAEEDEQREVIATARDHTTQAMQEALR